MPATRRRNHGSSPRKCFHDRDRQSLVKAGSTRNRDRSSASLIATSDSHPRKTTDEDKPRREISDSISDRKGPSPINSTRTFRCTASSRASASSSNRVPFARPGAQYTRSGLRRGSALETTGICFQLPFQSPSALSWRVSPPSHFDSCPFADRNCSIRGTRTMDNRRRLSAANSSGPWIVTLHGGPPSSRINAPTTADVSPKCTCSVATP